VLDHEQELIRGPDNKQGPGNTISKNGQPNTNMSTPRYEAEKKPLTWNGKKKTRRVERSNDVGGNQKCKAT
jgi:hypothetical protein